MRDFNRVIELKPDYANAWFNRGEIRYDQGQHEEAAADYSQALRLNDKDAGAYACRGHAYFQLRQFQQALADYDQAVRLDGKSAEALANRADAYQSLGQWEQAAVDYRGSVELDQRLGRAYLGAAWLMATCPRDEIRNADLAIEAAKKAIELEGEQKHQHLDTLAAAYANAGLFDQAKATLEKAIRLAPEADAKRMRERLALYDAGKPYRQDDRSTVRSAVRSSSAGASP
jgi:tetratricopeptide (TPR) repeat protein